MVSPLRQAHANYGNTHRHSSAARQQRRSQSPSAAFARPGERSSGGGGSGSTPQPGDVKTITVQGCDSYLAMIAGTHNAPEKASGNNAAAQDLMTCAVLFALCYIVLHCIVAQAGAVPAADEGAQCPL